MKNSNVFIFGDSYSTFIGYIPDGYAPYYTGTRTKGPDMRGVEDTWWHKAITETSSALVQNNSWSGSTVCHTGYNGADTSSTSSFVCRFDKLKNEGFFRSNAIDTVLIFGGTNDNWANSPVGELKFSDWEKSDLYALLPALCYILDGLKAELPDAKVACIINSDLKPEVVGGIKSAAEHYGAVPIALHDIEKLNGHPTVNGMEQIKEQVLAAL